MVDDSISDEDKALFRHHMRSVKPLNEKTIRAKATAPKTTIPPKKVDLPLIQEKKNIIYRIPLKTPFFRRHYCPTPNQDLAINDSKS